MNTGIRALLIDIFYKMATQNLKLTFVARDWFFWLSAKSFIRLIIFSRISLPFKMMYSTPLSVEVITEIKLSKEWVSAGLTISSISAKNWFLTLVSNRKMSFLISSYTRFFLSSGDIYRALTLRDRSTSTMPLTLPSTLALMSLFLCSVITVSLKSLLLSHRPSLLRIWSYFSNWIL